MSDKATLLLLQGHLCNMPIDDQRKVHNVAEAMNSLVRDNGDAGILAAALIGGHLAAEVPYKRPENV